MGMEALLALPCGEAAEGAGGALNLSWSLDLRSAPWGHFPSPHPALASLLLPTLAIPYPFFS